mmetsp:Transcript_41105/g.129158  ORF Transcript_41105/g.129158 Transcript_41105/m.129158 type:complete len:300 (-) Transcript_41105:990-1889(-)
MSLRGHTHTLYLPVTYANALGQPRSRSRLSQRRCSVLQPGGRCRGWRASQKTSRHPRTKSWSVPAPSPPPPPPPPPLAPPGEERTACISCSSSDSQPGAGGCRPGACCRAKPAAIVARDVARLHPQRRGHHRLQLGAPPGGDPRAVVRGEGEGGRANLHLLLAQRLPPRRGAPRHAVPAVEVLPVALVGWLEHAVATDAEHHQVVRVAALHVVRQVPSEGVRHHAEANQPRRRPVSAAAAAVATAALAAASRLAAAADARVSLAGEQPRLGSVPRPAWLEVQPDRPPRRLRGEQVLLGQ